MSILQIQARSDKDKVHQLRKKGILPMAFVRRETGTTLVQTTEDDLKRALKAADGLGRVEIALDGGKPIKAIVRNIEKDFRSLRLVHAVLQEVSADDMMRIDVNIVATGTPPAVADGQATLLQQAAHIKLKGKMSSIPEHLEVDVSHLEVGHHVSAQDVALPDGVTLLSSPDATLFTVSPNKEANLTPSELIPSEPATEESAE